MDNHLEKLLGVFSIEISIPSNKKRYRESFGDALKDPIHLLYCLFKRNPLLGFSTRVGWSENLKIHTRTHATLQINVHTNV